MLDREMTENFKAFLRLIKASTDARYQQATYTNDNANNAVFDDKTVHLAWCVYLVLINNKKGSRPRQAYESWKLHNLRGDEAITIQLLIDYVDDLNGDVVNKTIKQFWGFKGEDKDLQEAKARMYILAGHIATKDLII